MSLYRQPGAQRRRRRVLAATLTAVVAAGVLIAVLAGADGGAPSRTDRAKAARSAATEAANGLELLRIEYGQAVKAGRVVAPTEYEAAKADVQRAQDSLSGHAADLAAVDPTAQRRAEAALQSLGAAVRARVDATRLEALVRRAGDALARFTGSGS